MLDTFAPGSDSISDEDVVGRIQSGETSLYPILMDRYHHRLYPIMQRMLRNDAEVEDTMQTAHVRALMHLNQFSARSSFFTWLTRIMINEAMSRTRRTRRHRQLEDWYFNPNCAAFMSRPLDPEERVLQAELNQQLRSAIDKIPPSYRAVFRMREIEEMNTAEVARSLGISEQCVKCRLHRARKLLQRQLHQPSRHTWCPWRAARVVS